MFQVIRQLHPKERKKIPVHTENGVTASEKKQVEIVTNHFKEVSQRRGEDEIKDLEPTEMKRPFTEVEIRKSVSRLKNNKSTGIDDISTKMIKYSPKIVYQQIADIFNEMAKTGNIPDEVIECVLVPLPKPGKPQGQPANLRPIILLSILRKILAICMINRIQEKIDNRCYVMQCWLICTILLELSKVQCHIYLLFILGALQYTMLVFGFPSLCSLRWYEVIM